MDSSRQGWQAGAVLLGLIAVTWAACGVLFVAVPAASPDQMAEAAITTFQLSRSITIVPAFAMGFLAYLAWRVSRRPEPAMTRAEVVAVVGTTWGVVLALFGLALLMQPPTPDTFLTQLILAALCMLPGLLLIGLSTLFWWLMSRQAQEKRA